MGLADRLVGVGEARGAAESLAREIAKWPERCMRSDRLSVYEQWGKGLDEALESEFVRGMEVIRSGETLEGAMRFRSGQGRHGSFE